MNRIGHTYQEGHYLIEIQQYKNPGVIIIPDSDHTKYFVQH